MRTALAGIVALGLIYVMGDGLPQVSKKAFELFSSVVKHEEADPHYSLGVMYREGDYVECNMKRCLCHWEQAAIMGHKSAKKSLVSTSIKRATIFEPLSIILLQCQAETKIPWNWFVQYACGP
jgi:TPR repeat protein